MDRALVDDYRAIADAAALLVKSVSFDDNGALIGGKWMGGHGGLISEETRRAADVVRRALSKVGVEA